MVSMMTYFFSVRGFGHPAFLKPHFGHPVMKFQTKTLPGRCLKHWPSVNQVKTYCDTIIYIEDNKYFSLSLD